MKFTVNSKVFQKGIGLVEKAVSQRSSLDVLENVYIDVSDNSVCLRGNDLEIGIQHVLTPETTEALGSVLVKAKTLSTIVGKLPNESITVSTNDKHVLSIKGKTVDFEILGCSTDDYPVFPSVEQGVSVALNSKDLKELIRYTVFSVSFDETKQFMNGILVKNVGDRLLFIATDGYRLALKYHSIVPLNQNFSVIIPFKAVNEMNKILQSDADDNPVELIISDRQAAFRKDDFLLVSRLVDGQFPDYNQVIPKESSNHFSLSRKELLSACERASIIAAHSNNVVRFYFGDEKVILKSQSPGMGEFQEEVTLNRLKGSGPAKVAFNVRLVLDAIRTLEVDDVRFEFEHESSPCRLEALQDDTFTYIVMPIRISEYERDDESVTSATAVEPATPVSEEPVGTEEVSDVDNSVEAASSSSEDSVESVDVEADVVPL